MTNNRKNDGTRPLKRLQTGTNPFVRERPEEIIPWVIDLYMEDRLLQIQVKEQMIIGRGSGAGAPDVDLGPFVNEEHGLSRRHAILLARKRFLTIRDLNSTNGTYINGLQLAKNQDVPLEHGDAITFGKLETRLMFAVLPPHKRAFADSDYQTLKPMVNGTGRHVLVVEDDTDVALTYQMMLRSMGYRVSIAVDLSTVGSIVHNDLPDAVIVDIHMHHGLDDYTGLKVLKMVRALAAEAGVDIPLIVVSGAVDNPQRQRALEQGAHLFLPKPVRVDELAVRVGMLIEQLGAAQL